MKKRTNIYLDDKDKALLQVIRESYRLDSDAAAVRFAINKVASDIPMTLQQLRDLANIPKNQRPKEEQNK